MSPLARYSLWAVLGVCAGVVAFLLWGVESPTNDSPTKPTRPHERPARTANPPNPPIPARQGDPIAQPAENLSALVESFRRTDPREPASARETLERVARVGTPEAVLFLAELARTGSIEEQTAACGALAQVANPLAEPILAGLFDRQDSPDELRRATGIAMARIGGALSVDRLVQFMIDHDEDDFRYQHEIWDILVDSHQARRVFRQILTALHVDEVRLRLASRGLAAEGTVEAARILLACHAAQTDPEKERAVLGGIAQIAPADDEARTFLSDSYQRIPAQERDLRAALEEVLGR